MDTLRNSLAKEENGFRDVIKRGNLKGSKQNFSKGLQIFTIDIPNYGTSNETKSTFRERSVAPNLVDEIHKIPPSLIKNLDSLDIQSLEILPSHESDHENPNKRTSTKRYNLRDRS
jgi:hypothetical protein